MTVETMGKEQRRYWIGTLCRIVDPVLHALAERNLKKVMPLGSNREDRARYTHLEALGRCLSGLAPWLEGGGGGALEQTERQTYAELARRAIDAGTDPTSPDFMNFSTGEQPVVDAAILSHALVRAPRELITKLDPRVKRNLATALSQTRKIKPEFSNWLLFSAMVETAMYKLGEDWDVVRIDYALRQHEQWYKGDGIYGDGPDFHWDYYNSFVIHPMMLDILEVFTGFDPDWDLLKALHTQRVTRYADIQERLISPEGTFPAIGRSLAYRFGAFHLLAQASLHHLLPAHMKPAQVRCALSTVVSRTMNTPGNFDSQGWLTIGFCGDQSEIGEFYISTGSLYLCTTVFLPLGLPYSDPFWQDEYEPWTSRKAWAGQTFAIDHAIEF